ncbi:hypothetical protein ABW19_dt0205847 [Dactylella cylindrospora]|nr:hypothetical protein ABW19_dt0205847 [Dactylella cylindrospora]
MGDVHPRTHRRSLIVSSTIATEIKQNLEGPGLKTETETPISSSASDSITTASTNSPTMYGPTLAVIPPVGPFHHPHMSYMPQAPQPRYHQTQMQTPPMQQPFNMQALQSSLQQYQIQAQPRYGPVVSPQPIQYSVSPMQIPATTAQPLPVYGMPQYPQPAGYYDPYSQSPPAAAHGFPVAGYSPSYPAPPATSNQPAPQYAQWPQGSMPFMYLPQYGQPAGTMSLSPPDYSTSPTPSGYGSRRRSAPQIGYEAAENSFGSHAYDPNSLSASQRQGVLPRHLVNSGSRQRRGSPVSSNFNTGRSSTSNLLSLSNTSSSSISSKSPQSALHPALPRGPPRKPRQSGHALWVGNLPPGTTVSALKDYFATDQIESVFLISKSNCAFVNYKTESACNEAMTHFHDSRFQGGDSEVSTQASESASKQIESATRATKERYFIVKSLTLEDLDSSVSNGIWATQTHNEPALNEAYQTAENVFLIFSANKSGEYYGYARMASEISEEVSSKIEWAPIGQSIDDTALPKAIYTPATATAPRGRIIDDSSRGTIFWEVVEDSDSEDDAPQAEGTTISKSWGKPFRVEWVSTAKVPFYRTRGLRNPYNVSREVKIARDGTELEPSVGRRLLQMFHRGGALPFESENTQTEPDTTNEEAQIPEVASPTMDA